MLDSRMQNQARMQYNARIVEYTIACLAQIRGRQLASINILILILSFCFLFEATLLASNLPSQFSLEFILHFFPAISLFVFSNLLLIAALALSFSANKRFVQIVPSIEDACLFEDHNDVDFETKWIVEEFSRSAVSACCIECCESYIRSAHIFIMLAVADGALATLFLVVLSVSKQQLHYQICIVLMLAFVLANILSVMRKAAMIALLDKTHWQRYTKNKESYLQEKKREIEKKLEATRRSSRTSSEDEAGQQQEQTVTAPINKNAQHQDERSSDFDTAIDNR